MCAGVRHNMPGVQHNLRRLEVPRNAKLQINQASFGTLLALPVLEWLELPKCEEPHEMSQWTFHSVGFLVRVCASGRSCGQDRHFLLSG